MDRNVNRPVTFFLAFLLAVTLAHPGSAASDEKAAGLADMVPDDVFLFTTERANPERDFLKAHFSELGEALKQSGVEEDVRGLVASLLGEEGQAELDSIEARIRELLQGVDWCGMSGGEFAFAERMNPPQEISDKGLHMGPPDMVWLFRGSEEGAATNFKGLVAILEGVKDEVNNKLGAKHLTVELTERLGAEVAVVDLLAAAEGAPSLSLGVARRGGLIVIALGEEIVDEVLTLSAGKTSGVGALGKDPRFRGAFSGLPKAEDGHTFFDMQALLSSVRELADRAFDEMDKPKDVVINSVREGKAHDLSMQAWEVYEEGEYARGLELVEEAYAVAPTDSRVLYYLACFQALNENQEKALDFLERSVDGGFYSPGHISKDPDLESIRPDPRYAKALARATEMAAEQGADRSKVVRAIAERVMGAPSILDYIASVKFTDGLSLHTVSRAELVADAKSNPIYPVISRRAHAPDFDRHLPQETASFVVSNGVDPRALYSFVEDMVRVGGEEGESLLGHWAELQKSTGFDIEEDLLAWIDGDLVVVSLEKAQGTVVMLKVSDAEIAREKVDAGLGMLTEKLAGAAKTQPMLGMLAVRRAPVLNDRLEGFESLFIGMSPKPVVWGVADHHLIFASSPEAVLTCLDTAAGDHPGIRENPRAVAEWIAPEGPFTSVTLSDQRELGEDLAKILGMASMGVTMAGMQAKDPQSQQLISGLAGILTKLAPVAKKIDFIESTAVLKTFDGKGWTVQQVIHFEAP